MKYALQQTNTRNMS